jgi:hypothetical protein
MKNAPITWSLFLVALFALGVLAPLVPDEPFHLSGVMVVLGLICGGMGLLAAVIEAVRGNGPARRAAVLGALANGAVLAGWLAWLVAHAMSQLS